MSADRGSPEAPASHSEGWRQLLRGPTLGHVILVMLALAYRTPRGVGIPALAMLTVEVYAYGDAVD